MGAERIANALRTTASSCQLLWRLELDAGTSTPQIPLATGDGARIATVATFATAALLTRPLAAMAERTANAPSTTASSWLPPSRSEQGAGTSTPQIPKATGDGARIAMVATFATAALLTRPLSAMVERTANVPSTTALSWLPPSRSEQDAGISTPQIPKAIGDGARVAMVETSTIA